MSEIIGFKPLQVEKQFQGQPVDSQTGLVGFNPNPDTLTQEELGEEQKVIDQRSDLLAEQTKYRNSAEYWEGVGGRIDTLRDNVVEPLSRPVSGAVGKALDVVNNAAFEARGRKDLQGPAFETAFKQGVELPRAEQADTESGKVVAGAYNAVAELVSGLTSADAVAMFPAAANKAVLTTWISQMAGQVPKRVIDANEKFKSGDTQGGVQEIGMGVGELVLAELGRRHVMPKEGPQVQPPFATKIDTGLPGSGIVRPPLQLEQSPLAPKFELRDGETWKQLNQRVIEFQKEQKQLTDFIEAEVISTPESRILGAGQQPAALIENGRGPLITPKPVSNLERAAQLFRMARLQDNPILIEGANAASEIIGERERNVRPNPEGGKVPALDKADPFNQLPEAYRPDPASDLKVALEQALRDVLKIPKEAAPPTAPASAGGLSVWRHAGPRRITAAQVNTVGSALGFHVGNKEQADWVAAGKTGKGSGGVVSEFTVSDVSPDGNLIKESVDTDMSWEHPDALLAELTHQGLVSPEAALRVAQSWGLNQPHAEALSAAITKGGKRFEKDFAVIDEDLSEFLLSSNTYKDKAKLKDVADLLKDYGIGAIEYKNDVEGRGTSVAVFDKTMLSDASSSDPIQSPSPEIKTPPASNGDVKVTPPVATKPWEMRQRLQERSRSQVDPIPKAEPAPKDPTLPSMPAVENFKEVPDNHPAVVFWSSPDSASYARVKAAEAFPDNPVLAADVATEAHAHLYLTAGNMPSGRVGAKPWGMRVMSNYIMDKARGIQRERKRTEVVAEDAQSALETTPDTAMTPEQEVRMGELESALEKVTSGLDAAERAVYDSLRGESDFSFTDIAKQQGVSVATISRRAQEIRQRIARSLFKEGVDGADYIDIVEKLEEQAASAQPKGIGASARKRMKSGRDEGGFFNPSILAPLGRIIRGWMQAGASAARAVGHAVKLFGRRIFAPATRIARAAGFSAPAQPMGRARAMRPLQPYIPGAKSSVSQATARYPGKRFLPSRPANWAALDVMEKAGLTDLVNAGSRYESRVQEWTARWTTPNAEIEQKFSTAEYKQGVKEFGEYFKIREARDNTTKPQAEANANAYYLRMSPAGKELVDWQRWVVSEMGDISRQLGVQVQERNGNWRLGNFVNDHYPRRPSKEFKELVKDPQKNLAEFNQLKADMVRNGNAATLDEAEAMLYRDGWHDTSTSGFFANAEKARGNKLPDRVYQYDLPDFIEYVDRNAERLAQIEAFGQSLGGKADTIFEVERSKTTDQRLQRAIQDLRNHYYRDPLTTVPGKLTRAASSVSTVAYMGLSGMTAVRNAMTAVLNSTVAFGATPTAIHAGRVAFDLLESAAKTAINVMGGELKSARTKDSLAAQEIGAVMHDLHAASLMDLESSTARSVVGGSLVFNSMAERAGRQVTTGASMTWLRHTRWFNNNRPNGYMARNRLAQLERYGYTGSKLQELLQGNPSIEAEWQRTAVNEVQFNYKAKNASTLFDRSWAKVFGQFQKYSFMQSRFVDRNVVEPLNQKQGGKWTPNIAPLMRLLVGSVLVGEAYQELRDKLFNKPRKTASWEEIKFAASKDTVEGLKLLAKRVGIDVIYGSGLGIIGDVGGMAYEYGERGRFKNPLSPPLFNLVELLASRVSARFQRGATLEGLGDDLNDLMSRIPFFSQVMGAKDTLDKTVLSDKQEAALAEGEYVKAEARPMLARFGKEYGINRPSKFNASMAMLDENSAELDAIYRALLSGDSKGASQLMGKFITESENKTKAVNVLRGSIDRRNPLYSATAGVDTPEKADAFIQWVRQFDPEKAKRFTKVFLRYRSASGQD